MTLVLLGFNILIIMALWHFVVKKTLLDHTRDKLFDLRDELRDVYVQRGWGLDAVSYGKLRAMINAYLRFTENYSVWQMVAIRTELSSAERAGLREYLTAQIDANFGAESLVQQKFIADVRRRASNALTDYSVYNSGFLLLVSAAITPVFLVTTFIDQFRKGMSAVQRVVMRDFLHWGRIVAFVWARSTRWVASKIVDQHSLEVTLSNESHGFA